MSPSPKAQRLRDRLSINPDELPPPAKPAPAPAPSPDVAPPATTTSTEAEPPALPEPAAQPARRAPARTSRRARPSATPTPARLSAVEDPGITPGRKDYRSFYIEDAAFARFRAAIYWLARREDAAGVPENMSVAVEAWMQETADELERRYNDGEPFRMPPVARRRRSTS